MDPLAKFWCSSYEEAHGLPYPFGKADGVILHRLKAQHGRYALAWMIREFHQQQDPWLETIGWSVKALQSRALGLAIRYRETRYKAARASENVKLDPKVVQLADRLARRLP